jgi:hypothetical protein
MYKNIKDIYFDNLIKSEINFKGKYIFFIINIYFAFNMHSLYDSNLDHLRYSKLRPLTNSVFVNERIDIR